VVRPRNGINVAGHSLALTDLDYFAKLMLKCPNLGFGLEPDVKSKALDHAG
jgi:hypothetical protein